MLRHGFEKLKENKKKGLSLQMCIRDRYVGGILGFGSDCLLLECSTESKGYILGSDYVGGIVGGLTQHANNFSRIGGGISVTTNAGYVIGYNYVGGIIGKNDGSNKVENCVNNGVAAGYTSYIGGIVGYNGEGATVSNCVSYISDHSGEIFNRIVNTWKAAGSYAGGIAGYNNGTVAFTGTNSQITVKSVSGIVAVSYTHLDVYKRQGRGVGCQLGRCKRVDGVHRMSSNAIIGNLR